jgi:hypothetical protein
MLAKTMIVTNPGYLDAEQLDLATRFEAYVRGDLSRTIRDYYCLSKSHRGKWINGDIANLLCLSYMMGGIKYRWKHSDSVRSTAAAVAQMLVQRAAKPGPAHHFVALFGPPASGKTSSGIRDLPCDYVFEWTMGSLASARRTFAMILENGHSLTMVGVLVAQPAEALRRVVDRALQDGRAVGVDWIARSYTVVLDNFLAIRKQFGDNVEYRFIDNSKEPAMLSNSLDWLERFRYAGKCDDLREFLHDELRRYQLPPLLYEAMRPYPSGTGGPCG